MPKKAGREKAPFPTRQDILDFLDNNPVTITKREIARAFRIRGSDDRQRLKTMLRDMGQEGLIKRGRKRSLEQPGVLPSVTVIEVIGPDIDGELTARPATWPVTGDEDSPPPLIYIAPGKKTFASLGRGDRALARLKRLDEGHYEASILRRLEAATQEILGLYRQDGTNGRIIPTDKRARNELVVDSQDAGGAEDGELVMARLKPGRPRLGLKPAVVTKCLGRFDSAHSTSLIAIHTHGIPHEFSKQVLEDAKKAKPPVLGNREDLRDIPLITIDPSDARDHDDALWAKPDDNAGNKGGWYVIVAIADVAHYVQPGTALDAAARERGNSVYFPDRVVPMLPTALSNNLCSLVAGKDRACMAAHLWFDRDGRLIRHKFTRGLMRCVANLAYGQVQTAIEGAVSSSGAPSIAVCTCP